MFIALADIVNRITPFLVIPSLILAFIGFVWGVILVVRKPNPQKPQGKHQGFLIIIISLLLPFLLVTLWGALNLLAVRL